MVFCVSLYENSTSRLSIETQAKNHDWSLSYREKSCYLNGIGTFFVLYVRTQMWTHFPSYFVAKNHQKAHTSRQSGSTNFYVNQTKKFIWAVPPSFPIFIIIILVCMLIIIYLCVCLFKRVFSFSVMDREKRKRNVPKNIYKYRELSVSNTESKKYC